MKSVEVLLRERVPDLGRCGDVVKVAAGYARNYLLPRRLAIQATEDNKRAMGRRRERLDAEELLHAAEISKRVDALASVKLSTAQRADENGHLYGSVSAGLIAELLAAAGFAAEEKSIRLGSPIKTVGSHTIQVHVHGERHAEVTVTVEAEVAAT